MALSYFNLPINYYRWLNCLIQQDGLVLVNIPSAFLKVYTNKDIILQMKIIAGKPSTPTPAFSSIINDVILYPYWIVPHNIAAKELLPKIKLSRAFLDEGNYQVINKQGKILDPVSINWQKLHASYFPYIIRQSTGCDNALGIVKINFYSPFDVYLHDTPIMGLFLMNKRFFSHGCMRLEDANSLARLVLKENTMAIDTLTAKGCLLHQEPVVVPATNKLPLVVWYNPVDIDKYGRVVFYDDPYNKFNLGK